MRAFLRLAAPALVLLLLAPSCGHISLDQGISLAQAARSTASALAPVSTDEEVQVGRAVAARVAGRYRVLDDPALTRYVTLVGLVCATNAGRPDLTFRFAVLDAAEVNAFAAPGGYVFVTRGAIGKMDDEAMLAGVLSHEIAHVARKHILKEIQKTHLAQAGKHLAEASGKIPQGVLDAAADTGAGVLFKGYSRSDEYDADLEGTAILRRAGYPADGLLRFLGRLQGGPDSSLSVLFATHPKTGDRIERLKAELGRSKTDDQRPVNRERFRKNTG